MGIDAVGVVGGTVPHRQHAAACADGNGRFEDARRRPRGSRAANGRLAEQLPLLELLANEPSISSRRNAFLGLVRFPWVDVTASGEGWAEVGEAPALASVPRDPAQPRGRSVLARD
jgi:hypothetical protein